MLDIQSRVETLYIMQRTNTILVFVDDISIQNVFIHSSFLWYIVLVSVMLENVFYLVTCNECLHEGAYKFL